MLLASETVIARSSYSLHSWGAVAQQTSGLFFDDIYRNALIPLGVVTCILGFLTRPKTSATMPREAQTFMWTYLCVWYVATAADWLQGPYVYALYASYGFPSKEIAELFVAGFSASMIFGSFAGSVADTWGRRRACLMYCVLYILSCVTKHFASYWILMVGRVFGGIATSILFSCFESWLVSENQRRGYSGEFLQYVFSMAYFGMYAVAIGTGILSQTAVDAWPAKEIHPGVFVGGYTTPFDMSSGCLLVCGLLLLGLWGEDQVTEGVGSATSLSAATSVVFTNWRVAALGCVVFAFEGSMYAFVFNWTPALESKVHPTPHGLVFALFMMACMCGSSFFALMTSLPVSRMLTGTMVLAVIAMGTTSFALYTKVASTLEICFYTFLLFEFCVGVYFPASGALKSSVVPENVRATVYNLYRVPLNGVVCLILLTNFALWEAFGVCTALLAVALLSASSLTIFEKASDPLPAL